MTMRERDSKNKSLTMGVRDEQNTSETEIHAHTHDTDRHISICLEINNRASDDQLPPESDQLNS